MHFAAGRNLLPSRFVEQPACQIRRNLLSEIYARRSIAFREIMVQSNE
jgi:hypothetical protein